MRKYWVITEPLRLRALTVSGIKVQNVLREEDADEVLLLGLFTLAPRVTRHLDTAGGGAGDWWRASKYLYQYWSEAPQNRHLAPCQSSAPPRWPCRPCTPALLHCW